MVKWSKYILGKWSWKRPLYSLSSIYILLLLAVIFMGNRLIFFPPPEKYADDLPDLQFLKNKSGQQMAVIYKKARPNMPTLLWSHGNAEDISLAQSYIEFLNDNGYGVLIYDYPGYGLSDGSPSESGCYTSIETAWKHLTETLKIPQESLFIVGQSVGSGPSVWLAEKHKPAGLVLISPFQSINRVPFNINPFPYDRFPNIKRIANVSCPLLVIHGDKDEVIGPSHGKALYEKHTGKKSFFSAVGCEHNDILTSDKVNSALFEFLKSPENP